LEHWLADGSSSLESGHCWSIEVCAGQRPLWGLHSGEGHLCCPIVLASAVAVPDTAGDFGSRKTSWEATAAARWRGRGVRWLVRVLSWLVEACKHWQDQDAPRRRVEDRISKFPSHASRDKNTIGSKNPIVHGTLSIDDQNSAQTKIETLLIILNERLFPVLICTLLPSVKQLNPPQTIRVHACTGFDEYIIYVCSIPTISILLLQIISPSFGPNCPTGRPSAKLP
jgi:hypothetical protein